jgi:hypothetical protein
MDITVTNILQVSARDVGFWVREHIMNRELPQPGPNHTLNIQDDLVPLLAVYANNQSLATELHSIVTGDLVSWKLAKKRPGAYGDVKNVEENLENLKAIQEILYRCIQTLQTKYDAASRMMTGLSQIDKLNRGF